MFDRPQRGTRAVLVQPDFHPEQTQESLEEFRQLAVSAGVEPLAEIRSARSRPDPTYLVGSGKAAEILAAVSRCQAELVLFNHPLSPAQERNLERYLQCRVVDRTGLILDIFAQRAHTFEGKLQVELAQLRHLSTRLIRGWSHLERQKGGIGLRGPGETQLETDRRLIGKRIKQLNKRLEKVCQQRQLRRHARRKATVPVISLVGYTNAGKSTLFNRLTGAGVYAADQLFATLDPTLRRLRLPALGDVVLVDTVGFIRDLPPQLVAAFRATLEETIEADLLLHVVDAADPDHDRQIAEVGRILADLGVQDIPQIEVYNKIDLKQQTAARVDRDAGGQTQRVWLSARSGAGIDLLEKSIAERLLAAGRGATASTAREAIDRDISADGGAAQAAPAEPLQRRLRLLPSAGRLRAQLFEWKVVQHESTNDRGEWLVDVVLKPGMLTYLQSQAGCRIDGVRRTKSARRLR